MESSKKFMLKKGSNITGKTEVNSPDKLNRLVEQTVIKGDVKANSNFRIDGSLEGTVTIKGKLVVGPSGYIKGDVICDNADIEGTIDGNVKVTETLSLKKTANIIGNIKTGQLAIDPGAVFTGSCDMGGQKKASLNSEKTVEASKDVPDVVY